MLKYVETMVGFSEVPEEITLCINISNCPIHCKGCHSPHLWKDIGQELTPETLFNLIASNPGITCVAFMGGDNNLEELSKLAEWVKHNTELKVCWYSGRYLGNGVDYDYFDYIKVGPYEEDRGSLDKPTTNQKFYKIKHESKENSYTVFDDITYKFWKNETDNKDKAI